MSIMTALTRRLLDDSGVKALADNRIHWGVIPQGVKGSAIRLNFVSHPRPQVLSGLQKDRPTRIQADCFASSPLIASQLAEALIEAIAQPVEIQGVKMRLSALSGPIARNEQQADGTIQHWQMVDFTIWHNG